MLKTIYADSFLGLNQSLKEFLVYLPVVKDIIICISILAITFFVCRAVSAWRYQIIGNGKKDSAYKLRMSIIQLREEFINARKYSASLQHIADSFSLPSNEKNQYYQFEEVDTDFLVEILSEHEAKYEALRSSLVSFNQLSNEAEALFGTDIFHYKTIVNTECQNLFMNFQKFKNFVYRYDEMCINQIGSVKELIRSVIDLPDTNLEYLKFNKNTRQFVSLANQMVEALEL
jgi:hypothetical protein